MDAEDWRLLFLGKEYQWPISLQNEVPLKSHFFNEATNSLAKLLSEHFLFTFKVSSIVGFFQIEYLCKLTTTLIEFIFSNFLCFLYILDFFFLDLFALFLEFLISLFKLLLISLKFFSIHLKDVD